MFYESVIYQMPPGIYHHLKQNPVTRFWRYVDKKDEADCWPWTASKTRGYGSFKTEDSKSAHRFSYFLHHPYTSHEVHIRHSCDNPACVNPAHLSAGTHADNMNDMKQRGRAKGCNTGKSGCNTNRAALNETQIKEIRERLKSYKRGDDAKIAENFGITRKVISNIRRGISYLEV